MRSAPQSLLCAAISLIKVIVSSESLGFLECAFVLRFQNQRKSSRCQREMRLWLNKEERLFPGPNHAGQNHEEKAVRLRINRSFDLSAKDHELLP